MRWANDELMVIAMVETVSALDDLDAIAATDGIDVLWIGHFDLTASMGIAGQFDHPRYAAALAAVVDACERNGNAAGISTDDADHAVELARQGFRFIAVGHDIVLLRDALQQRLAAVRAALPTPARH